VRLRAAEDDAGSPIPESCFSTCLETAAFPPQITMVLNPPFLIVLIVSASSLAELPSAFTLARKMG